MYVFTVRLVVTFGQDDLVALHVLFVHFQNFLKLYKNSKKFFTEVIDMSSGKRKKKRLSSRMRMADFYCINKVMQFH